MSHTPQVWEDLALRPAEGKPVPPSAREVQAAYLAHELRAPVTSIRLGLELLSDQVRARLDDDERRMLEIAIRNTTRLEGLVDDIMDYSKISAGRMALLREPREARALVEEAVDALKAAATAKGIRLVKDVGPLLPRVSADGRRVVQVLVNLLSNAIKFTPARGVVTVSVREGTREHGGTLLFKVKDTGMGIPADKLESIFGLFEQAGAESLREGGTGLGLTLARAMVSLHGGRIWAESWAGCGATLCFTIPIARGDLSRPVEVYAPPLRVHGLLADLARRFNSFLALFV